MKKQTFVIPAHINYLSDYKKTLPKDCLFDKGSTGCGGTTLAITNKEHYVICVPFVPLITNKMKTKEAKKNKLFAVKGGITVRDIKNYIANTDVVKIIVTYDSLNKVVEALGDKVADVNILIDEMHLLLKQYIFRKRAVSNVLSLYKVFKSYCFMTATMIKEKFLLKEMQGLPIVEYKWEEVAETTVKSVKCVNAESTVIKFIKDQLECGDIENFYFFVNSVKFINSVCNKLGLTDENALMICSKDNTDKKVLKISEIPTKDEPKKKINFITSTAFEGCDFFDEEGVCFVVSDASKAHTLVDISTTFNQIAGRIRNSKHKDSIYHLYTSTRYNNVTTEEFDAITIREIDNAKHIIKEWDKLDEIGYGNINGSKSLYIHKDEETDRYYFDENAVIADWDNFENSTIYSMRSKMNAEYKNRGLEVAEYDAYEEKIKQLDATEKMTFKDYVAKLKFMDENPQYTFDIEFRASAFKKYPFLKEAINKLGFAKLGTLNYVQKDIKAELVRSSSDSEGIKIAKVAKLLGFSNGEFIPSSKLKNRIGEIYTELGIKRTPKAADIDNWFEVKPASKRVDGKMVAGFTIIRNKIIINNLNN